MVFVAIHRLDRLTSGLLLFAKSLSTAQLLEWQIRERRVVKEYICKVQGKFPRSEKLSETDAWRDGVRIYALGMIAMHSNSHSKFVH